MKNYFKKGQCEINENQMIENLQWSIDNRARFPDHEAIGWIFNYIKSLEGGTGGGDDKRLEALELEFNEFTKVIKELGATFAAFSKDLTSVINEVQKHNSGIVYLKKEIDAINAKLQPVTIPEEPPAAPVPEPKPTEPVEPKPAPGTVKSSKKK